MVVVALAVLLPHFHIPIVDPDEGILACGAERILRGQVPYRDFFSELGPASFYLHALMFKLGSASILSLRGTAWLLGGLMTGFLFLLARKVLTFAWAIAAVAPFPLACYPLAYRVSHHWWANAFLLLAILALAAAESPEFEIRRCVGAGVLAGMTLLTMQSKGFWAVVAGLLFFAFETLWSPADLPRRSARRALAFVCGVAMPVGCMAAFFAMHSALAAWFDANVTFLFANYRVYLDVPQASVVQTVLHIGRLAWNQPSVHLALYIVGYVFLMLLAPLVAFGGGAVRLLRDRKHPSLHSRYHLLLLLAGLGAFISESHSPDIIHLMWASPLLLVLFVAQCERLYHGAGYFRRSLQLAGLLALSLLFLVAGRKAVKSSQVDGRVETRRGILYVDPRLASQTQARLRAIEQRVASGGKTFLYPYMPDYYLLAGLRNPTRYDVLLEDFNSPAQVREAIASLGQERPAYIFGFDRIQLWTIRPHFPDDPPDAIRPHPVGRMLAAQGSGYELETVVEDMEIWKAKP